jgi:hypothetical protein
MKAWAADKQPVALLAKNDWIVQVIPQQAINDKGHTGDLYSKNSDPAAGAGAVLFTFYCGVGARSSRRCVLWSGEFQGFIIHELVPSPVFFFCS